jgi:hypothetical protein
MRRTTSPCSIVASRRILPVARPAGCDRRDAGRTLQGECVTHDARARRLRAKRLQVIQNDSIGRREEPGERPRRRAEVTGCRVGNGDGQPIADPDEEE